MSAASVKGLFAIDLPLSGLSGVEDRGTSRNGRYLFVMTFNNEITSAINATVSCGPDGTATATIDPTDAHKINVSLVGVKKRCSESDVVITADVSDGTESITASATMGFLIDDVNSDRVVDAADVHLPGVIEARRPTEPTSGPTSTTMAGSRVPTSGWCKKTKETRSKRHLVILVAESVQTGFPELRGRKKTLFLIDNNGREAIKMRADGFESGRGHLPR